MDALEGSADFDKDGYLTGSELGTYIHKRTAEDWKGELTQQRNGFSNPVAFKTNFKGRRQEEKSKYWVYLQEADQGVSNLLMVVLKCR